MVNFVQLAGDDISSLDSQSDEEILTYIKSK